MKDGSHLGCLTNGCWVFHRQCWKQESTACLWDAGQWWPNKTISSFHVYNYCAILGEFQRVLWFGQYGLLLLPRLSGILLLWGINGSSRNSGTHSLALVLKFLSKQFGNGQSYVRRWGFTFTDFVWARMVIQLGDKEWFLALYHFKLVYIAIHPRILVPQPFFASYA